MTEIILGGVVAAISSGLILYYLFGIGKSHPKSENKVSVDKSPTAVNGNDNITNSIVTNVYKQSFNKQDVVEEIPKVTEPTPRAVFEEIRSRPLLQQKDVGNAYIGQKITWEVKLFGIREYKDIYNVSVEPNTNHIFPDIVCDVKKIDYPLLKTMHSGEVFYISGKIALVDGSRIRIEDAKLIFISK